jgi:hypothetical protein
VYKSVRVHAYDRIKQMKKQCTKCLKKLPATNKFFYRGNKDALRAKCIACYKNHCKDYYKNNSDKFAEYQEKNRKQILQKKKEYRQKNKKKIAEYKYIYHKNRYKNDLEYRLLHNCGNHIRKYLKQNKDSKRSTELLGCNISFLRAYLEKQFDNKMSWDNYGSYWHIDHIIPCSSFDFSDPVQQQQCFYYTNLQPLEAKENIKKSNKIT